MKFIALVFLIFCFLKSFYYGIYEIKNNNSTSGKIFCILSVLALIFPTVMLILFYF